ncbi:TetR/AcrR family transcriptional regulator [Roseomonas sp. CCTCC AB2023176]|uniref:TetR/AcrR family transcriptional regulator n=1 Tax=Roseomonas sp. CCTCC AB2023176 TaxID=3342640 RepID=UPI0035DE19C1
MTTPLAARVSRFKQDHILDAAVTVFARKGFRAASMRDVAAAAGVAAGSIYNHFDNKAALLLAIFDRLAERAVEAAPPAPLAGGRDLLVEVIRRPLVAMTEEATELFRVLLAEVLVDPDLAEEFRRRVLGPMLEAGGEVLAQRLPERLRATGPRLVSAIVLGLLLQRLLDRDAPLPPAEELADALLAGLQGGTP